jgi:hypothetical protein
VQRPGEALIGEALERPGVGEARSAPVPRTIALLAVSCVNSPSAERYTTPLRSSNQTCKANPQSSRACPEGVMSPSARRRIATNRLNLLPLAEQQRLFLIWLVAVARA